MRPPIFSHRQTSGSSAMARGTKEEKNAAGNEGDGIHRGVYAMITKPTYDFLMEVTKGCGSGTTMCELGNQHVRVPGIDYTIAKKYFKSLGFHHASIDMNGLDGAVRLDLSKVLALPGTCDVVTNFGTSEHIPDQPAVFENIHNLCRVGGIMVHAVPMTGNWENHGDYYYTVRFFTNLASLNGYEIVKIEVVDGEEMPGTKLVCAALEKQRDSRFIWDARGLEYFPVRMRTRLYSMVNTPYQNLIYRLKCRGGI